MPKPFHAILDWTRNYFPLPFWIKEIYTTKEKLDFDEFPVKKVNNMGDQLSFRDL